MTAKAPFPHLSPRQAAVVAEARDGASLAVVGQRLGITRYYAAHVLSLAYKRLEVDQLPSDERREVAYRIAVKAGLIAPTSTEKTEGTSRP
jgi:hypothetical protein